MKKHRTSLFRILILSLVMLVTVFIIAIAWFSSLREATASGISVKSTSGLGLDSSFNGVDYSSYIYRPLTSNFKFPLITGNGEDGMFFIPALERSSGTPLDATSGKPTSTGTNWLSKRAAVASHYSDTEGDYYVEDIWFRSSSELDLYLSTSSYVKALEGDKAPSEWLRKSDFGEFTKDYIAGAARVSFSKIVGTGDSETETPLFVWVPNEKYHLQMADDFQKIPSTGTGVFDPNNPNRTFGLNNTDKFSPVTNLYTWEVEFDKSVNPAKVTPTSYRMFKGTGDDTNYYVAVDVSSTTQVDHGFLITENDSVTLPDGNFLVHTSKDNSQLQLVDPTYGYGYIEAYFENSGYNYNNSDGSERQLTKLTINVTNSPNEFFGTNDHFQLLFAYNPTGIKTPTDNSFQSKGGKLQVIGFVYYNENVNKDLTLGNYIYNGAAGIGPGDSIVQPYYSMENGSTVVITNNTTLTSQTTYALNANTASASAVRLEMVSKTVDSNTYIAPGSPLASMMYTVSKLDNGGYTLKSLTTGKYLSLSDGKIALSDTASEFALSVGNGGPMLSSGGFYLSFSNGQFGVSNTSDNATLQIYQGTSYSFRTNGDPEEAYKYYNKESGSLTNLSNVKFTSQLGDSPLLRLTNSGTSGDGTPIYSAHIRIRIWAEGTDREAKIPLAGGIFTTHLEFQGVPITETP